MKKIISIALSLVLALSMLALTGCGSEEETAETTEVTVLAAASLTDALDEIIAEYEKDANCTITPSYAGSGDLVQQIEGGAPCDIFISASKANMDQLEEGGYIDSETRQDMLTNTLTLISTIEKKDSVTMDSLTTDAVGTIAVGEPETVPAGKYASQVFDNMQITDQLTDKIVYAKDVRAVLNYVETGDADCGFVYKTDALLIDDTKGAIIEDVDSSLHDPIVYPAAIMKEAPQAESAADFYDFLQTDFAKEVFEKYGFSVK
ncbi:MAG: molybdate ABC transporter substrate-binding protein [Bacillota bacterium]|nr:molybdate ABC transporter substrate-binding protein [Bacillota bacterium]